MTLELLRTSTAPSGQETGQVTEGKFLDLASLVAEELGAAAVGKGVLGDALVGQGVVVVGYLDLLGSYIHLTLLGGNIPDVGGTKVRKSAPSASAYGSDTHTIP